jgi:hypothetical protein
MHCLIDPAFPISDLTSKSAAHTQLGVARANQYDCWKKEHPSRGLRGVSWR